MLEKAELWDMQQFVEVLNKEVPLDKTGALARNDKRRSDKWTERMVRTYFSSKTLTPPVKDGKHVFYNRTHLEEFKELVELQSIGMPYKAAASYIDTSYGGDKTSGVPEMFYAASNSMSANNSTLSSSLDMNSFDEKKQRALDILKGSGSTVLRGSSETSSSVLPQSVVSGSSLKWSKERVGDTLEIQVREDLLENKEALIQLVESWLNKYK